MEMITEKYVVSKCLNCCLTCKISNETNNKRKLNSSGEAYCHRYTNVFPLTSTQQGKTLATLHPFSILFLSPSLPLGQHARQHTFHALLKDITTNIQQLVPHTQRPLNLLTESVHMVSPRYITYIPAFKQNPLKTRVLLPEKIQTKRYIKQKINKSEFTHNFSV